MAKRFRDLGFDATTSRFSSREEDNKCVDLCGVDPFAVQCKSTATINCHTELEKIDGGSRYKVLVHKRKQRGCIVALPLDDFMEIVELLVAHGCIKTN
jgi:hypothetical protein